LPTPLLKEWWAEGGHPSPRIHGILVGRERIAISVYPSGYPSRTWQ